MATQSKSSNSNSTGSTAKASTKRAGTPALDLPVGAVLTMTDRVGELVEPFSGRKAAEKQLKTYRTQLRREVKRAERRGATARKQATSALKRNRTELEQRVRKAVDLLPVG
jgi:hypothetical protein